MPLGDDERIDVDNFEFLWYWATTLGVTRDELKRAVEKVGTRVGDVRKLLAK